jgi:quinol monooxygenase YgiN
LARSGPCSGGAPRKAPVSRLPAERLVSAICAGIRYARNNAPLRATLLRAIGFFLFASAYWSLLPLVARSQLHGGAALYGVLLGAIGTGAVGGAFALPYLQQKLGPDHLVAAGTLSTAGALILFGIAHDVATAFLASLISGISWIVTVSTLNVSAQLALPGWVRGRGLAIYVTAFYGALTLGSVVWGEVASLTGLPMAQFLAAAGAFLLMPVMSRFRLHTTKGLDLTPSMFWPAPIVAADLELGAGPVMVMVEYRIAVKDRDAFLAALEPVAAERRRDGAYVWDIFEDTAEPGRFIENFLLESWAEHLRQHERVTKTDRVFEARAARFLLQPAKTTHLIAAQSESPSMTSPAPGG